MRGMLAPGDAAPRERCVSMCTFVLAKQAMRTPHTCAEIEVREVKGHAHGSEERRAQTRANWPPSERPVFTTVVTTIFTTVPSRAGVAASEVVRGRGRAREARPQRQVCVDVDWVGGLRRK